MLIFDGKQTEFQSEIHKIIWVMGRRIVPFDISTAEITDNDMLEGLRQVYDFTVELFSSLYETPSVYELTAKSVSFFHEYIFLLFKNKKATLVNDELSVRMDSLGVLEKDFIKLGLYAPVGICYALNDGVAVIRNIKYPLFFKYYAMCFKASQKRPQNCRAYVMFCDFRIFNKRFGLKIDDLIRTLPDRERAIVWDIYNHLKAKGANPAPRINYDAIHYEHNKNSFLQIKIGYSTPLRILFNIVGNADDDSYKFVANEIEKLPNKDEVFAYIKDSIRYCNICYPNAQGEPCGRVRWADFFGKQQPFCGGELKIPNKQKNITEHDVEILKMLLDIKIGVNQRPCC